MAAGYGTLQDILDLSLAQFYGALEAEQADQKQRIKDHFFAVRIAAAESKHYKAAIKELDK